MCQLLEYLAYLIGECKSDCLNSLLNVLNHWDMHIAVEMSEELLHCVEQVRYFSVGSLGR